MIHTRKHTETINKIELAVRSAGLTPTEFRYVIKIVRANIGLSIPKDKKTLPQFLTASEIYHLLDANKENYGDALLCEFLIFTGLRISEARNLQISAVDMSNNMLKVVEGKGGKDRYVPITSNLLSKLRLYLKERKSGFVFAKKNETAFTIRALQYRVEHCLDKAKIDKKLSTHSLRHTFGCLCLARGMDIMKIRDMMGHSDVKITQIYAKCVLPNIKEEFLRLMDVRA